MDDSNITTPDAYPDLLAAVRAQFAAASGPLFTTDADGLFDLYLDGLPAERQRHTCSACRRFLRTHGGLVTVAADGALIPALWDADVVPDFYRASVDAIARRVCAARITGVFMSNRPVWGTPTTGAWTHLAVTPPPLARLHTSRTQTPFQAAAEKTEDYRTISRALAELSAETLTAAVHLLESSALYRAERVSGPARWLRDLHATRAGVRDPRRRENLTWLAVATAPAGYCHPRGSMIGTLLEDIAAGLPVEQVRARFAEKMDPTQYRRARAAPAAGVLAQAEKLFARLELAPALARRYAQLAEIPPAALLWTAPVAKEASAPAPSLFGHLQPRPQPAAPAPVPTVTMTWEKFQRTVLPTAHAIAVQVPARTDRFMALVTAVDEKAPPILQWDRADARNPFSWYYAGGIDAEMRRRLTRAGGRYQQVALRCSLLWNNYNDLDLHVVTPLGKHIYYGHKNACRFGGYLDVDMNAGVGVTDEPVENVRWEHAPAGRYRVYANLYTTHRGGPARTPFTAEIAVGEHVHTFTGMTRYHNSANRFEAMELIADFTYQDGAASGLAGHAQAMPPGAPNAWGLVPGMFAAVTAMVPSPNLWGDTPQPQHGQHVFFLLDGCRDTQDGVGRGFLPEMLRGDLHPVRAVMEAYAAQAPVADAAQASACGVGISAVGTGNLTLRVTAPTGTTLYTIDRWD